MSDFKKGDKVVLMTTIKHKLESTNWMEEEGKNIKGKKFTVAYSDGDWIGLNRCSYSHPKAKFKLSKKKKK